MLCDKCKKRPATVHITKITNGVKSETHLCGECAREEGELTLISESTFSFPSLLTGLLQTQAGIGATMPIHNHVSADCENCGLQLSDFTGKGFLGCSHCYSQFGSKLEPLLRRIHGNSVHTGKVPKRLGGKIGITREIENLRRNLARLVSDEKYEEAAVVRDEIKALEKRLSDDG
ncbi:MAG: hypothetical protein GX969_06935 [Firmicutes bacterium]|nr:hypothetical protein [Bacillota bacterium]